MAGETTVQIRIDSDLKEKVEALYVRMGTTFSEAVRIFAVQSVLMGRMPITVRDLSREHTAYGMLAKYGNPELRKQEHEGYERAMKEAL